jgi:hypothetical protein
MVVKGLISRHATRRRSTTEVCRMPVGTNLMKCKKARAPKGSDRFCPHEPLRLRQLPPFGTGDGRHD